MENLLKKTDLSEKGKEKTQQMLGLSEEDLLNLKNPTEEDINKIKGMMQDQKSAYQQTPVTQNPPVTQNVPHTNEAFTQQVEQTKEFNSDNVVMEEDDDVVFDLVQLPSKGLCYPNKQSALKVAYLTAEDENILTSPNLLRSGKAIELLLKRKILDKDINYDKLLSGDRDAIIMFLRNTAYGTEYEFVVKDPVTGDDVRQKIDLSVIKSKELTILPDENGEFEFMLPNMKKIVKFKYLTVRDEESFLKRQQNVKENEIDSTYTDALIKHIVEFDGNRDKNYIKKRISKLLVRDSKELRRFIKANEPTLDLLVDVDFPSGGTEKVALPINASFLWPEL